MGHSEPRVRPDGTLEQRYGSRKVARLQCPTSQAVSLECFEGRGRSLLEWRIEFLN